MKRTVIAYSAALAGLAVLLQWLAFRHAARDFSTEAYLAAIAAGFVALGIWIGIRLTPAPRAARFVPNEKAIAALGVTAREREVLACLAKGDANKEIARRIGVSPNTVKTHVASIYAKLGVTSRGKAVDAARALSLVP